MKEGAGTAVEEEQQHCITLKSLLIDSLRLREHRRQPRVSKSQPHDISICFVPLGDAPMATEGTPSPTS